MICDTLKMRETAAKEVKKVEEAARQGQT